MSKLDKRLCLNHRPSLKVRKLNLKSKMLYQMINHNDLMLCVIYILDMNIGYPGSPMAHGKQSESQVGE